jgi:hypothetical protein
MDDLNIDNKCYPAVLRSDSIAAPSPNAVAPHGVFWILTPYMYYQEFLIR